jgi:hypothetical protein
MSEPVGEGVKVMSQVFDGKATFESLKGLVGKFLRGEQADFILAFDQHVKLTEDEFNELLGDYGSTSEYIDEVNGVLVHRGEYVYDVGEKEVGPGEVIVYLKRLYVTYHVEEDNGKRIYVIHSVEGASEEEGWEIEKGNEAHYLFYNDFVYLAVAEAVAEEVNELAAKGCITKEQAKAISDDIYKSLVTISDGFESEAEAARRHLEELSKSIHDKYEACFGTSREG